MSNDPLLAGLADLAAEPSPNLIDRIAARWVTVEAPIGEVFVAYTDGGIAYLRPAATAARQGFRERFGRPLLPDPSPAPALAGRLRAALHGESAPDLTFDLSALSAFQAAVLRATRDIPRGEIRPYAWVARQIGSPRAVRAVGTALATNPVPLLIPCHRVTRSDGALGAYIFGADTKRTLLEREGVLHSDGP